MTYNQEILKNVVNMLATYNCGKKVFVGTLLEVRLAPDLYVSFGWLSEPVVKYRGKYYDLITTLDVLPKDIAFNIVGDLIDIWKHEFTGTLVYLVGENWAKNYNAIDTIFTSIAEGHEYNVYVPMLDSNFTNELEAEDEEDEGDDVSSEHLLLVDSFVSLLTAAEAYRSKDNRHTLGKEPVKDADSVLNICNQHNKAVREKLERDLEELRKKKHSRYKLTVDNQTIKIDHVGHEWLIQLPDNRTWMTCGTFDDYVRSRAEGSFSPGISWELMDMINAAVQELWCE
jgi:hypothetical protein